jgi:hypothetical protein
MGGADGAGILRCAQEAKTTAEAKTMQKQKQLQEPHVSKARHGAPGTTPVHPGKEQKQIACGDDKQKKRAQRRNTGVSPLRDGR